MAPTGTAGTAIAVSGSLSGGLGLATRVLRTSTSVVTLCRCARTFVTRCGARLATLRRRGGTRRCEPRLRTRLSGRGLIISFGGGFRACPSGRRAGGSTAKRATRILVVRVIGGGVCIKAAAARGGPRSGRRVRLKAPRGGGPHFSCGRSRAARGYGLSGASRRVIGAVTSLGRRRRPNPISPRVPLSHVRLGRPSGPSRGTGRATGRW